MTDHIYLDHKIYEELEGSASFVDMLFLSVASRLPTANEVQFLNHFSVAVSFADPRIWPLKVTKIIASYGNFGAGVASGLLCVQDAIIGPWSWLPTAKLLCEIESNLAQGHSLEPVLSSIFSSRGRVPGFGVKGREVDERGLAIRRGVNLLGRDKMSYWKLANKVERELDQLGYKIKPNVAFHGAAALLDLRLEPESVAELAVGLFSHMFIAHASESVATPSAQLRQLPEKYIAFDGHSPRVSPRKSLVASARE